LLAVRRLRADLTPFLRENSTYPADVGCVLDDLVGERGLLDAGGSICVGAVAVWEDFWRGGRGAGVCEGGGEEAAEVEGEGVGVGWKGGARARGVGLGCGGWGGGWVAGEEVQGRVGC